MKYPSCLVVMPNAYEWTREVMRLLIWLIQSSSGCTDVSGTTALQWQHCITVTGTSVHVQVMGVRHGPGLPFGSMLLCYGGTRTGTQALIPSVTASVLKTFIS